jgi:hypothetical protein
MLARLATSISCYASEEAELVAEHMVHLLALGARDEEMYVTHLAEPRLALAAAYSWNTEGDLEKYLLPALQHALISGLVSAGDRSELVAQVVLLKAFDTACKKRPKESRRMCVACQCIGAAAS